MEDSVAKTRSAFNVGVNDELPGHLHFWTREDWQGEVPADQTDLIIDFDNFSAVIRARFRDRPEEFSREYFRLLGLAQAAFSREHVQVAQVSKTLQSYKMELVRREGPSIKNEHLKELAWWALFASIGILIIAALIRIGMYFAESYNFVAIEHAGLHCAKEVARSVRFTNEYSPLHFGFLLAAAMWGIWLSSAVRNMEISFEQLQSPESDFMRPWARLLTFGMLAFILALFFQMGILVISIGGVVSTSQISDNLLVAIFIGICLGFTDKLLPGEVQRRIEEFFQRTQKTGQ
jgi:hypothetical protein